MRLCLQNIPSAYHVVSPIGELYDIKSPLTLKKIFSITVYTQYYFVWVLWLLRGYIRRITLTILTERNRLRNLHRVFELERPTSYIVSGLVTWYTDYWCSSFYTQALAEEGNSGNEFLAAPVFERRVFKGESVTVELGAQVYFGQRQVVNAWGSESHHAPTSGLLQDCLTLPAGGVKHLLES